MRCSNLGAERPRTAARPRRARAQTRQRHPLRARCALPAVPPTMRRGRRNSTLRRRRAKRTPPLNQPDQPQPSGQSELASTVLHVRPPSEGLSSQTAPSVGAGRHIEPFTKSVSRTARPASSRVMVFPRTSIGSCALRRPGRDPREPSRGVSRGKNPRHALVDTRLGVMRDVTRIPRLLGAYHFQSDHWLLTRPVGRRIAEREGATVPGRRPSV
jgi:hypothetical protein